MRKTLVLAGWLLLGLIGPAVYLAVEQKNGLAGFPLDDSWIHQTYARSLADGQGWSYTGGFPSAGSTSPLWTVLQVPSYWFHISPVVWSTGAGILLLLANAILIMRWTSGTGSTISRWAFLFCVGEWHLVWAAVSGMETILFCSWISLMVYVFFPLDSQTVRRDVSLARIFLFGLMVGLGIWIRPEAILLSGLVLLAVLLQYRQSPREKAACFLLAVCMPLIAYFSFQWNLNGHLLPNTFFVKSAEYSELTSVSLWLRLLQPWIPVLAGSGIILAIFLPAAVGSLIRERKYAALLPALWALGHVAAYAVQLPATYQHGRYYLPVLPVLIGYGVYGYSVLAGRFQSVFIVRTVSRTLWASAAVLTPIFLWIGAQQFSRDVGYIEKQMVTVSQWIRDNTAPDAVVAAHDIGALGFWSGRRIVDLGGVTDLQALPLLNGTVTLWEYLRRNNADFLMTIPEFYRDELRFCEPVPDAPNSFSPGDPETQTQIYEAGGGCGW